MYNVLPAVVATIAITTTIQHNKFAEGSSIPHVDFMIGTPTDQHISI